MKAFIVFTSILTLIGPALAGAPVPPRKDQSLTALQERVATEKARQMELGQKAEALQKDVTGLKDNLIETAAKVQRSERELQNLNASLLTLQMQKTDLDRNLAKDRTALSDLLLALGRLRRLPPETLVAKPGSPRETAQAATALSAILPELNSRAANLKTQLTELSEIEEKLSRSQAAQNKVHAELQDQKKRMDGLLTSRSAAFNQTQADFQAQQKAVTAASKEASDFADLLKKIERQNRALQAKQDAAAKALALKNSTRPPRSADEKRLASLPSLGNGTPPVSGPITSRFGQRDQIGAISKGVRFAGMNNAIVVAPLGGIVRYAGAFKSYGNIILLEHKNNFHSLIAGLGRIDTFVGQSVESGEPVGSLGSQSGQSGLYYELRLHGEPIDPARKFSNLGS